MSPTPHQRKFTLNLLSEWRRLGLPFKGGPVVLAVSGGADSCALALGVSDLVKRGKITCEIVVAHFDHGLRGEEGARDGRFVAELTESLGFRFVTAKAAASLARAKANIEEKARIARYGFLLSAAERAGSRRILTAHTRNDQAETLLMNLIRGSGLTGLSGMEAARPLEALGTWNRGEGLDEVDAASEISVYRPLLRWAGREDTEKYAADCGVDTRNDPMNEDESFLRVRIRKEILPKLEEINPKAVETLARTAETLRMELELLLLDPKELERAAETASSNTLPVASVAGMTDALCVHTVRNWLLRRRGSLRSIDHERLRAIADLARSSKSGRSVELPGKGRVLKRRGRLCFEDVKVEK